MFDCDKFYSLLKPLRESGVYRDRTGQAVIGESGNIIWKKNEYVCFHPLNNIYQTIAWDLDITNKDYIERVAKVLFYAPITKHGVEGKFTELHEEWESFILSHPAWKDIVEPQHKRTDIKDLKYLVDVRGIAGSRMACLLSALRYLWAHPYSLVAFKMFKEYDIPESLAFFLAAGTGEVCETSIRYEGGFNTNHFCVPNSINYTTKNFLYGIGNDEGNDYSESGTYKGVARFATAVCGADKYNNPFPMTEKSFERTVNFVKENCV